MKDQRGVLGCKMTQICGGGLMLDNSTLSAKAAKAAKEEKDEKDAMEMSMEIQKEERVAKEKAEKDLSLVTAIGAASQSIKRMISARKPLTSRSEDGEDKHRRLPMLTLSQNLKINKTARQYHHRSQTSNKPKPRGLRSNHDKKTAWSCESTVKSFQPITTATETPTSDFTTIKMKQRPKAKKFVLHGDDCKCCSKANDKSNRPDNAA